MRYQIWIVAGSFVVFGAIAWLFLGYSPADVGLMGIGVIGVFLGLFSAK